MPTIPKTRDGIKNRGLFLSVLHIGKSKELVPMAGENILFTSNDRRQEVRKYKWAQTFKEEKVRGEQQEAELTLLGNVVTLVCL